MPPVNITGLPIITKLQSETFALAYVDPTQSPNHPGTAVNEILAPLRPLKALNPEARILLIALCFFALWGVAIAAFGLPALLWPMKLAVPGIVLLLVLITWSM